MIVLDGLTKRYGDVLALDDVSLEVPDGCIFAFLGKNGSGKTTTIRILTGLMAPTAGSATINGEHVTNDHVSLKQVVGYVPDQPYLYEDLTGAEYLWFIGGLYDLPREALDAQCADLLRRFGLRDAADRLTRTYSRGMRQRLAFCGALLIDPPVLILDEPWAGLDPHNVRMVKDLLLEKKARGDTIFLSTHTLAIAQEIGDVIGVLEAGRLLHVGSVAETLALQESGNLEDVFLELTPAEESHAA